MDALTSIVELLGLLVLGAGFIALLVFVYVVCERGYQEQWRNMTDEERENEIGAMWYIANPNDPIWPKDPFSGKR